MKAWRLDRLGGMLRLEDAPVPEPRAGGVVVKIEASALMSYLKAYVEGALPICSPPDGPFTPGGNAIGRARRVSHQGRPARRGLVAYCRRRKHFGAGLVPARDHRRAAGQGASGGLALRNAPRICASSEILRDNFSRRSNVCSTMSCPGADRTCSRAPRADSRTESFEWRCVGCTPSTGRHRTSCDGANVMTSQNRREAMRRANRKGDRPFRLTETCPDLAQPPSRDVPRLRGCGQGRAYPHASPANRRAWRIARGEPASGP
jgi:hypothetical protein